MAALGSSTYLNSNTPLFAPLGSGNSITVSTINAVGGDITATWNANNFVDIFNATTTQGIINQTTSSINNTIAQKIVDANGASINSYTNFLSPGLAGIIFSSPAPSTIASLTFDADVGGGNGGIQLEAENGETVTIGNGKVEVTGANMVVSTINGLPYPIPISFLIYNLTPGSSVSTLGITPVVVATQATSAAGKAYRVTCVYDVSTSGSTTVAGDYSELQITGTGVSIFSMETTTFNELVTPLITPGQSKTSSAVFVDADGGGFNVEIIANANNAVFDYTFYSVSVERLN